MIFRHMPLIVMQLTDTPKSIYYIASFDNVLVTLSLIIPRASIWRRSRTTIVYVIAVAIRFLTW